jgi:hypothetical protein
VLVVNKNKGGATYPRDDLRLALLAPLDDLGVDLVPQLGLDLARVAGEEREEALRPAVDHVDLVQRHRVHDLFAFLDFAFGALDEFCLRRAASEIQGPRQD